MFKSAFSFAVKNARNAAGFLYSGGYAAARKSMGIAGGYAMRAASIALKNSYVRQMTSGAVAGGMYGLTENLFGEDRISVARGALYGAGTVAGWKGFGAAKRAGLIGRTLRGTGRPLRRML